MKHPTRANICEAIAKSLREFGYPDVTATMVGECLDAWIDGKRDLKLPHGVVGAFTSRQFDEVENLRPGLLATMKTPVLDLSEPGHELDKFGMKLPKKPKGKKR